MPRKCWQNTVNNVQMWHNSFLWIYMLNMSGRDQRFDSI